MPKILRVEAVVHSHATEDERKVLKALLEVFPPGLRSKLIIVREELKGHYNNPIVRIRAETPSKDEAFETFRYIIDRLDTADLRYLLTSLEDRVDRSGTLHIRLSKQDAYLGKLTMFEGDDVVKVSVHVEGRRRRVLRELEEDLKTFLEQNQG